MAQEGIQLVDTIFYFVDTMEEYTLMLEENKVLSRVIVFVDETQEIYKDGKLFGGYKKAVEKIDLLAEEVRQAMDLSDNDMRLLMRQLRETVWNSFEEEIQLIKTNVETYTERLERLKEEFDQGYVEQGGVILNVDELRGIIEEYAYWKTSVEGTLTTFGNIVNAQNATLRTFGERLDTMNYTVTNYEHIVDLKNKEVKEYIENYDITYKVRSILGREMLLNDGLLHDFATVTNVNDMVRSSVDVWFNSLEPSWTQLTSWALKGNDAYNDITVMGGINSKITLLGDTVDTMTASVSLFTDWYNGNKEFLAYLKAQSDGNSAFFDLQAQFDANNGNNELVRKAAARIFGYVNSEGSSLTLEADCINFNGYEMHVNVDNVDGLGHWALNDLVANKFMTEYGGNNIKINALPNDAYGIKASTGGFWLKLDGSGNLANGHITWDSQGNLRINGLAINGGGNVVIIEGVLISDYWSKTEFTPSNYVTTSTLGDLSGLNGGLKAWVLQQIQNAGTQEGQEINVLQIVQTTLENEISRANGPFSNYVTNSGLDSKLLTDGYIRREGLLTEVTGVIYNSNGDLIATGPLYKALAELETMSAAIIQYNSQGEPYVAGAYADLSISAQVEDYISHDAALSKLKTFALTIDGTKTAGFVLEALIKKMTGVENLSGNQTPRAYIEGVVNDSESNITISADKIDLDGQVLFDVMTGTYLYNNQSREVEINCNGISFELGSGNQRYTSWLNASYVKLNNGNNDYNYSVLASNGLGIYRLGTWGIILDGDTGNTYISNNLYVGGNTEGTSIFYVLPNKACFKTPLIVDSLSTGNIDVSGDNRNLTITGTGSKLIATELWIKTSSLFDLGINVYGTATFNGQVDIKSSIKFSGTNVLFGDNTVLTINSQVILLPGNVSTYTGSISIGGKTLTVKKGFICGVS